MRADYGKSIFVRLSEDLGIDRSTLLRSVQFYHCFPIVGAHRQLSWAHYQKLITVKDKEKRDGIAKRAVQKQWSYRQLAEAISLERFSAQEPFDEDGDEGVRNLTVTRAQLYTYQVLEPSYIHPIQEWLTIDLGFNMFIYTEMKHLQLKAGALIESKKSGNAYSYKLSDARAKRTLCL